MTTPTTKRPRYWAKRTITSLSGREIEQQKSELEGPIDGRFIWGHPSDKCAGEVCTLHNRTDHHMRSWHQHFRYDRGIMERDCPTHGTGHPDPDDIRIINGEDSGIHGCCLNEETGRGCCSPPT